MGVNIVSYTYLEYDATEAARLEASVTAPWLVHVINVLMQHTAGLSKLQIGVIGL